jgi:hypothetical protein
MTPNSKASNIEVTADTKPFPKLRVTVQTAESDVASVLE